MIIGLIHPGSGLGDQLFSYITTRTIALDKGYDFSFVGVEYFKGKDFMQLDWGVENILDYSIHDQRGEILPITYKLWKANTPYYDPEVNFIEDGTVIDGCSAQDERYWGHRLNEIREWLKVEPLDMPDDLCVINFRGGEYKVFPDLFLTAQYWQGGIGELIRKYGRMGFEIHTDDIEEATNYMRLVNLNPDTRVVRNIALNWRSVRYAKHLILANSAFGILPALLNENVKEVIAPKYWAGRNVGEWRRPQNYYKKFKYI